MKTDKRELDAWIAEHVMGWKRVSCCRDFCSGSFITNTDADCLVFDRSNTTWKPTTDPAAAMAVLERCGEKIATASLCIYLCCGDSPEYKRCWCIHEEQTKEVSMAETLPLAICLFAKELFGKEAT